jgi:hypothetical protein
VTYTFNISMPDAQRGGCVTTIPWSTGGGTATPGSDYTAASGSAIIGGGSSTAYATVTVGPGDMTVEPDETFNVVLGTPNTQTGTSYPPCPAPTVAKGTGVGTIVNDDGGPSTPPTPTPTATPTVTPIPRPIPSFSKTPPEVSYCRSAACRRHSVTFAWIEGPAQAYRASESVGSYVCRLDENAFEPCTSPTKVKAKRGKHVFQLASVDATGAQGPPASFEFKVKRRR